MVEKMPERWLADLGTALVDRVHHIVRQQNEEGIALAGIERGVIGFEQVACGFGHTHIPVPEAARFQ